MDYETIILQKEEAVATITLNRPDKLNALSPKMGQELIDVFRAVDEDDDVRVVLITGSGRAFCAGADIQETFLDKIEEKKKGAVIDATRDFNELCPLALSQVRKPVIAVINGPAVGFGCTITLGCDIRLAAENALFGFAFCQRGLSPEMGSTYYLPRLVGLGKACELVFTAKMINAEEALEIGLVNQLVPADELIKTSHEMAKRIAALAPLALQVSKRALREGMANDFSKQLQLEVFAIDYLRGTQDHEEGARSFLEKRDPIFKGK